MKVDWGEGRFRSTFDRAVWSEPVAVAVDAGVAERFAQSHRARARSPLTRTSDAALRLIRRLNDLGYASL
jgi:hypothetical protein